MDKTSAALPALQKDAAAGRAGVHAGTRLGSNVCASRSANWKGLGPKRRQYSPAFAIRHEKQCVKRKTFTLAPGNSDPAVEAAALFGFKPTEASSDPLSATLERWRKLRNVLCSLPLIAPPDHYRKSGNFGSRLHPATKRRAKRHGTDFFYYEGAPALAARRKAFAKRRPHLRSCVKARRKTAKVVTPGNVKVVARKTKSPPRCGWTRN